MANNSLIGALRVSLGLDTAQFSAGLKASQASLAKFGKTVAVGFAAVATAAASAGVAMGVAVKGAIDNADALSKSAQKIGVTTEALSRLKYAADFSDVSLEQLTGGLGRLSKTMLDVAGGSKGPAATAFKALGIAVTDAAGNLRNSDAVFADIAQRFAQMEDGSTKTALAISLFGKSGAELIPLLNSGKDGLAAMAAESDKLGLTISTSTGKAAEQFNDTLTKIGAILGGVVNKVMEAALPALQSLADTLASPQFAEAAATLATTLVGAFDAVVQAVVSTTNAIQGFLDWLNGMGGPTPGNGAPLINGLLPGEKANFADRIANAGAMDNGYFSSVGQQTAYNGFGFTDGKINVQKPSAPKSFVPVIEGAKTAKAAMTDLMKGVDDAQPKVENFAKTIGDSLASAFSGFADAVMSGVPAVEALSDMLGNLGKQLLNSAISNFFGGLFGGGFGFGGFKGTGGGAATLTNVGSFAGGGYTGMGARSGGVDGMGGFPAILHPNETVIDHSMGQSMSGGTSRVLVQMDQGLIGKILQQAHQDAVQVVKTNSPAAVATAQRDKWLG